jgi:8-oxo-dGTP pyrophosphatase MutT (NUDIX family)
VTPKTDFIRYNAAGGVLINEKGDQLLLLIRPARDEVRLPKGHIESEETVEEAAVREVQEETGYADIKVLDYLGRQQVVFTLRGKAVQRTEHYYLMQIRSNRKLTRSTTDEQFFPIWVTWEEAAQHLTFEAEREWLRRAEIHRRRRDER